MNSPIFLFFVIGIWILGGVNLQAVKTGKPPFVNLQAIKMSAARASQIVTSSQDKKQTIRKITEITIPSIVVPAGKDPSQLSTTSKDRKWKTEVQYVVKIDADLKNDLEDIKEYIIKPIQVLLKQMAEYHSQIKAHNSYVKEKILRQTLIQSHFVDHGSPTFYAYRTTSFHTAGAVIPFEASSLNNGCVFDSKLGEFTAPIKGIYYFYAQAVKVWGSHSFVTVSVFHNKKEIKSQHMSVGSGGDASVDLPLGIQSTLVMEEGDKMSLRLKHGAIGDKIITPKQPLMHKFTSLSGFLLQAL